MAKMFLERKCYKNNVKKAKNLVDKIENCKHRHEEFYENSAENVGRITQSKLIQQEGYDQQYERDYSRDNCPGKNAKHTGNARAEDGKRKRRKQNR